MSLLFEVQADYPSGFTYFPDFISEEEERLLLNSVTEIELHQMQFQGYTALRKVRSFGYDYNFNTRTITKGPPIPSAFDKLTEKVALHMQLPVTSLAEMLITEYPPGSVINWHRDAPPFDQIAGISLLSDVTFKLRPHDKSKQGRKSIVSFPVKRRSLYIIQGEARTEWQHSTAPVSDTRFSITFRSLQNPR
jgi:alkylated DNA repair dioxygenase AlkB